MKRIIRNSIQMKGNKGTLWKTKVLQLPKAEINKIINCADVTESHIQMDSQTKNF